MISRSFKVLMVLAMSLLLSLPRFVFAEDDDAVVDEKPSALAMAGDLVIARPIMAGVTVIGAALYVVSLPFSLAGGNAGQAAETLVLGPAETAFVRCLGCKNSGYKKKVEVVSTEEEE